MFIATDGLFILVLLGGRLLLLLLFFLRSGSIAEPATEIVAPRALLLLLLWLLFNVLRRLGSLCRECLLLIDTRLFDLDIIEEVATIVIEMPLALLHRFFRSIPEHSD